MESRAIHYSAKCTPRKARLLRPLIVGKNVFQALALLSVERRSGSVPTVKLIKSALAQLPKDISSQVFVADLIVNEGPKRRLFMPRAQGRATPVVKRTSHLTIHLKSK